MEAFLPMMMFAVGVIAAGLGSYMLGGVWMVITVLGAVFALTRARPLFPWTSFAPH